MMKVGKSQHAGLYLINQPQIESVSEVKQKISEMHMPEGGQPLCLIIIPARQPKRFSITTT
jgi:hypothetical protein